MHFTNVAAVQAALSQQKYIADRKVATLIYLAFHLQKPILVEGPAGVGKTELAKVLAAALDTELIRLQCYEGLDEAKALFEWNYQKQLLAIQVKQGMHQSWEETKHDIFTEEFYLARPLLKALTAEKQVVLLVDELDKSDEEFESFLLEALSDYQVSIPELGTVQAKTIPFVILTSNNYREFSDALKRRCLHLYIDYPSLDREMEIVQLKVPGIDQSMCQQLVGFVHNIRKMVLKKSPSVSETLDWAKTLTILSAGQLTEEIVKETLNVLLKYEQDVVKVEERVAGLIPAGI